MRELFQPDSLLIRFLTRLCDLILLNLATVFLCLTVVGSGTAVTSLYAMTLRMVRREDGELASGFLSGLRDNFILSTPATVLLLADGMLLAVAITALFAQTLVVTPPAFVAICAAILLLTALLSYLFPLLARYENPFPTQVKNAVRLAITNLPWTLLLTALNLLPVLSIVLFPADMGYLVCLWLLVGLAAIAYLDSFILRRVFDRFEETVDED